jgi:acetyl-CoA acetyltransferase
MTRSGMASICGIGATPYYKRGESAPQTIVELLGKASLAAVSDAGLSIEDIDGFAFYSGGFEPGSIMETLGIPEIGYSAVVSSKGGGSAGILDLAASAIETGRAKAVLCIGALQQVGLRFGQAFRHMRLSADDVFMATSGLAGPGFPFAMMTRRYMHDYGVGREAFAEVAISSRLNAMNRETAHMRKPLTLDDYFNARMIADPLCLFDFCLETDGALAFVVTSTERARDLKQPPVEIAASAHAGSRDWGRAFFWLNMPPGTFTSGGGEPVARRLYEQAGIASKDIDVALIYDHFSPMVLMQLEDYGFCGRGEAGDFVLDGHIRFNGGSLPVNTHGGHLSEAYIIGMTHIREAVEQLRGTAVNQVKGATHALVTGGPAPVPVSGAILRAHR